MRVNNILVSEPHSSELIITRAFLRALLPAWSAQRIRALEEDQRGAYKYVDSIEEFVKGVARATSMSARDIYATITYDKSGGRRGSAREESKPAPPKDKSEAADDEASGGVSSWGDVESAASPPVSEEEDENSSLLSSPRPAPRKLTSLETSARISAIAALLAATDTRDDAFFRKSLKRKAYMLLNDLSDMDDDVPPPPPVAVGVGVSERLRQLQLDPAAHNVIAIGTRAAALYRACHQGRDPPKRQVRASDGREFYMNVYDQEALPSLDAAIREAEDACPDATYLRRKKQKRGGDE